MRLRSVQLVWLSFAVATSLCGCRKHEGEAQAATAHAAAGGLAAPPAARVVAGDDDEGNSSSGHGGNKWKDTGIYLDGRPIGILSFGELPIALKPVWIEERHSVEVEPGSHSPGYKLVPSRRYRFVDLLRALGVDVAKVKQIHVMGPKITEVIIASGADLRSKKGKDFMFRFGADTGGKALPVVPPDFGNRMKPDKIGAVMVYIDKKPPTLDLDEGLMLDGQETEDVPYYGEPLRGGMRIYGDDQLALQIKKPILQKERPVATTGGLKRYSLWTLLQNKGIDTSHVVEGWVIADERRKRKLTRAELEQLTVAMGDRHKNELTIGDQKMDAQAIALHSRALSPSDLPQIRPEEE